MLLLYQEEARYFPNHILSGDKTCEKYLLPSLLFLVGPRAIAASSFNLPGLSNNDNRVPRPRLRLY